MKETEFSRIFQVLAQGDVRFILIGGGAAIVHGSARATFDVDIVYSRDPENLKRIVDALAPFHPYPRGAPPGLPFKLDTDTLQRGLNFTLTADIGYLDLLGEVVGGGTYEDLLPHSGEVEAFGVKFHCLGLERLIHLKRATGQARDLESIAELEAILEEREKHP